MSDQLNHPPAKLKRFEQWRQQGDSENIYRQPILEAFTISPDTDQCTLQKSLLNAALALQTTIADMIAHAKLPFSDPKIPSCGARYAHLYIIYNIFDLEGENVMWIFDGDPYEERNVQCAAGDVEEVLERVEMVGLIERVRLGNEGCVQRKVWKRVEMWVEGQW
jgi:hypothetical protein